MTDALGQMLPFALVIALSPIPLVAVIAMLFSQRGVPNGVAFLLGWVSGIAASLAVFTALASTQATGTSEEPSTAATLTRLVLGLLLLAAAAKEWRARPAPGEIPEMPRWMTRIDTTRPRRAFALAAVLGGANPKSLAMNIAAAAVLVSETATRAERAVPIVLYTAVASSSVVAVVGYRVITGARGVATLERMRAWFVANNATVMSVLFLVFGVKLVGDAIAGF